MVSQKPKIILKRWMPVAQWSLDIKVESCAICRNHIMDTCVECQNLNTSNDEDCTVAWGKCDHAFHSHCIVRWLKNKPLCPLDTQPWVFKKLNED
ncbi:RING-box protein 1 [Conglomerata obtusa]